MCSMVQPATFGCCGKTRILAKLVAASGSALLKQQHSAYTGGPASVEQKLMADAAHCSLVFPSAVRVPATVT